MSAQPPPTSLHRSLAHRFRSWFFTGLVVFGPVAVTAYIAWWAIDTVDNWVKPWLPQSLLPDSYLPMHVPGFGVVIALIGLTLLGFLTANIIGRSLVNFSEAMLDRTPLVRGVYKGLKQVFETVFSQSGTHFRKVGLVEFPVKGELVDRVRLFRPRPGPFPRPAGGPADDLRVHALHAEPDHRVFLHVAAEDVIELPISADEAAKLIMSAGLIQPEGQAALATLAEAAKLEKLQAGRRQIASKS